MMNTTNIEPYTLLRVSLTLCKKSPADLDDEQLRQVIKQAGNEYEIENRVLNAPEAASVIITGVQLDRAFAEVKARFDNDDDFATALANNGLDEDSLLAALSRQCRVEAVMERVASRAPKANDVEVGIYYFAHPEKFRRPEQRLARHILVSINPDYPENMRENALQRIETIADTLKRKPHKFADLALKNSECPTALNGGDLGAITQGKLYPELDEALFKLKQNQISKVVETEIGFHLIQCLKIVPAETLSLQKAAPAIKQLIQERYRRSCQHTWLASLPAGAAY
ncbi:MAG: nitrogen fixation protein NifM [Methylobacter sp.]